MDITWHIEPTKQGKQMRLRWQESGGPPVTPPGRTGFGSRLIQLGLAQDLDGAARLKFEATGVVCDIIVPFSSGDGP